MRGGIEEVRDHRAFRGVAGILEEAIVHQEVRAKEPGLDACLAKLLGEAADVVRLADEEDRVRLGVFDRGELVVDIRLPGVKSSSWTAGQPRRRAKFMK